MRQSHVVQAVVLKQQLAVNRCHDGRGVGKRPWNMAITPDGKKLYVAAGRSDAISVIDIDQAKPIKDISVGKLPWGVVIR